MICISTIYHFHAIRHRCALTISLYRNMVFDVWVRLVIFS